MKVSLKALKGTSQAALLTTTATGSVAQVAPPSAASFGLKLVAGALALVGLQIADIDGLSNALDQKVSTYPLHAQETAANIANYAYPWGHAFRYGILPGTTNWESVASARVVQWFAMCSQPDVIGYLPPGYYATGFNIIGTQYSGFKAHFDKAVIGGVLHVQSAASGVTVSSPKLKDVYITGSYTILDRAGFTNCQNGYFGDIFLDSQPSLNVATPGSKNRGLHIHQGNDALYFTRVRVTSCTNLNNTDAAAAIDGGGNNPRGIVIDELIVEDSDCHGLYLTGKDHHIKRCVIRGWSALQNQRTMEDSDNLAQSQRGCAVWINRATGVIDYLYVSQKGAEGERPYAVHELLVDSTDTGGGDGIFRIRNLVVENLGLGGSTGTAATSTGRGICIGDQDNLTGGDRISVIIENIEVKGVLKTNAGVTTNATLATGYFGINVFARTVTGSTAAGTTATFTGAMNLIDFGTTNGLFVAPNVIYTQIALARYYSALSARGTAFHYKGKCIVEGRVVGQWAGSSLSTADGIIWEAQEGKLGAVYLDGTTSNATTKVGLRIKSSYTHVGPIGSNAVRSDTGTVVFDTCTNVTATFDRLLADAAAPLTNVGIFFLFANTNVRIHDAALSGFGQSFVKHASNAVLTNLVFCNVTGVPKSGGSNGNLLITNYTTMGVCSGLPIL